MELLDFEKEILEEIAPLPIDLKNVLSISGYYSRESLQHITDNDIEQIEKFVREELSLLIEPSEYENFFGVYKKAPERYKMLPGHKSLLKRISNQLQKDQNKDNDKNTQENILQTNKIYLKRKMNKYKNKEQINKEIENSAQVSQVSDVRHESLDLYQESKSLKKDIIKYLKLNIEHLDEVTKNEMISKSENLKVTVKIGRTEEMFAIIECFLCSSEIKIYFEKKNDNSIPRWLRGNYYRHLKKHLINNTGNMISEEPSKNKKFKTLLHFFDNCKEKFTSEQLDTEHESELFDQYPPDSVSTSTESISSCQNKTPQNKLTRPKKNEKIVVLENQILNEIIPDYKNRLPETSKDYSEKPQTKIGTNTDRTRKLSKVPENQPFITNFFPYIDKIEKILEENIELKKLVIQNCIDSQPSDKEKKSVNGLLEMLAKTALTNKNEKSKGNRYDTPLKKFCCYLFIIGGKLLYETLYSNLNGAIPSITTIKRDISTDNDFEEGSPRLRELSENLEKRKLPQIVWLSEDGTRINGRIQYSAKTDKNVGFVLPLQADGFPNNNVFNATSVSEIQRQFREEDVANYAYVLVAQALQQNSSSFCYSVYGTDNKFTSENVLTRWTTTLALAENYGLKIIGMSSDGDNRLLKTMKYITKLSSAQENLKWLWFHADLNPNVICIQDTVHIGTKLRTRLTKPSILLPFGNHIISIEHLKYLLHNVSKDQHLLVETDINTDDKMNFKSVLKICDSRVIDLLKKEVAESDATVLYLTIMKYVLEAFLEDNLKVEERLYKLWFSVFILRIWRQWILKSTNYTLKNNFLSLNSYTCIELNAHSMIILIKKFSSDKELSSDMFLPGLMSSQPCEQMFRATRSMTSTFSTVVNYSMLDILNRLHRIQFLEDSKIDLQEFYKFPRSKSSNINQTGNLFHPMSDNDIEDIVLKAQADAIVITQTMGIEDCYNKTLVMDISPVNINCDIYENVDCDDLNDDCDMVNNYDMQTSEQLNIHDLDSDLGEVLEENNNDCELQELLPFSGSLNLKDYTSHYFGKVNAEVDSEEIVNLPQNVLKVVLENGSTKIVKKTSLCWLFGKSTIKLSSDRLARFHNKQSSCQKIPLKTIMPEKPEIVKEAYYAVIYGNNWYIGRVIDYKKNENFVEMKFLKEELDDYIWPKTEDIQHVEIIQIFYGPISMIGSQPLSISRADRIKIISIFKNVKKNYS